MKPPVRVIIFAKAPIPGRVKTRLIPALGADGAAALAARMLTRTVRAAIDAGIGTVELCASPSIHDPSWRALAPFTEISTSDQGPGDLGQRMARAARRSVARGEVVLLIGTDCVELDSTLLREAARRLEQADACLHPTADGGYALLGLRHFEPRVFSGIEWSTGTVAERTIARMRALGWQLHLGATLHDIDTPEDLHRLRDEP